MNTLSRRTIWLAALAAAAVGFLGVLRIWPAPFLFTPHGVGPDYYRWAFSHFAYSDLAAEYTVRHLSLHRLLYLRQYFEYPPVVGIVVWGLAWLPGLGGYLVGNAVILAAALFGASLAAVRIIGYPRARAFMFSPLLLVYAVYNWDILGILFYGLAVLAYRRRRWWSGGVFVGLGTATKLFPAVLWPFMALVLWRRGERRAAGWLTLGAAAGVAGPSVPVAAAAIVTGRLFSRHSVLFRVERVLGWQQFLHYNAGRSPDPGFWAWTVLRHWLSVADVNALTAALVALGLVVLLVLAARGLDPILGAATFLTWWLLCNKVYSPQYMMWVLYAFVLTGALGWQLWLVNIVGILDLAMAMVWLTLGNIGSAFEPVMGIYIAPVVILTRDVTLGLCVRAGWRLRSPGAAHKHP